MKTPQLVSHMLLIDPQKAKARIITLPQPDFLKEIHLDPLDIFLLRLFLDLRSLVLLIEVTDLWSFIFLIRERYHLGSLVFLELVLEHAEDFLFYAEFDFGYLPDLVFEFGDLLYILPKFLFQVLETLILSLVENFHFPTEKRIYAILLLLEEGQIDSRRAARAHCMLKF